MTILKVFDYFPRWELADPLDRDVLMGVVIGETNWRKDRARHGKWLITSSPALNVKMYSHIFRLHYCGSGGISSLLRHYQCHSEWMPTDFTR